MSSMGLTISFLSVMVFLFIMWESITTNRQILFPPNTSISVEWLQNFPPAEHSYWELPTITMTN